MFSHSLLFCDHLNLLKQLMLTQITAILRILCKTFNVKFLRFADKMFDAFLFTKSNCLVQFPFWEGTGFCCYCDHLISQVCPLLPLTETWNPRHWKTLPLRISGSVNNPVILRIFLSVLSLILPLSFYSSVFFPFYDCVYFIMFIHIMSI